MLRSAALAAVALCMAGLGAATALGATGGAVAPRRHDLLLRRGDGGPAVARLQLRLRVPADGVFGRLTERAVKAFQRSRRLTATGVVDRVTRSALGLPPFGRESVYRSSAPRSVRLPAPLVQIAMCESMGNPRAVSSDGRYRGKYQFSRETWRRLGGKGDPAEAPEWLQDWLALRLYRKRGSAPWPSCSGLPSPGRSPA